MNRKNIGVIIPILIVVELSFLFLACVSYSNKSVDEIKEVYEVDKKLFAMYIENENTGEYDEVVDVTFPEGYRLNESKTMCVDNKGDKIDPQVISYNGKKITVSSNKTIFCYIYFDLPLPDIKINNVDLTKLNTGKYVKSLDCGSTGTATFNTKYQRIEFENIVAPSECSIDYIEDTSGYNSNYINQLIIDESNNGNSNIILDDKTYANSYGNTVSSGYRYIGQNPDNYIWFNNEIWRIIGVIPTIVDTNGTVKNLVKIIRRDAIGDLVFDANMNAAAVGIWGSNSLYSLLNNYYFSKTLESLNANNSGYCFSQYDQSYITQVYCDYTNIGILKDSYYGMMIQEAYWNTGAAASSISVRNTYMSELSKQTIKGYVGIINASDFGYATNSSYYDTSMFTYENNSNILESNWLFSGEAMHTCTESSSADGTYTKNNICLSTGSGNVYHWGGANRSDVIKPVVYLKEDVYVIDGDGTESSPYQIAMK